MVKPRDSEDMLTIKQQASCVQLNERTFYRLAAASTLPACRVEGSWRLRRTYIGDWTDAQAALEQSARPNKAARRHQFGSEE